MQAYKDNLKKFIKEMIWSVDYFKSCSPETIEEISYYWEQQYVDKDTVIFRAGDPIDKLYFIINGSVNINVRIGMSDVLVDSLYQGCTIGCNGILGDFNHNFTARTITNTNFLCISKDNLNVLINSWEDLDKEIYSWKEYYHQSEIPYVDFRLYRSPDEKINAKDVLRLSIFRLLRIRRTLDRYHTAEEILQLLKDLQIQYNKSVFGMTSDQIIIDNNEMLYKMMEKIDNLTAEVNLLKARPKSSLPEIPKQSKTVSLQATPKDIAGIEPSRNTSLPTIFKSRLSKSSSSEESKE
jgi:hypothetical protein